jgi:thiol-disulfide isomerase/thioredoxin
MRPAVDTIFAPPFPTGLPWVNVASLRMDKQAGRPVLIEFWDFCRVNSLRTLPYLEAWHERYAEGGLRVVGIHSPGFEPSRAPDAVRAAVARLGIEYPVLIDSDLVAWREYGNRGWPARYLFDGRGVLTEFHYGEGDYGATEEAIQALLGREGDPVLDPLRPEDAPGALLAAQTVDQPGAYRGPYEAGGAWAVLDGSGTVTVGERTFAVDTPGCYPLVEHARHTPGVLDWRPGEGVRAHATCFTPGLADPPPAA